MLPHSSKSPGGKVSGPSMRASRLSHTDIPSQGDGMRVPPILALVAAALLLVLTLAWWARGRGTGEDAGEAVRLPAAAETGRSSSLVGAADAYTRSAGSSTGRAAPPPSLRQRFEAAEDLYAFAQGLTPALAAGDPEALWLMSRVADYCAGYSDNPAGYADDSRTFAGMELAGGASLAAARERLGWRCRRFVPSDGLSQSQVLELRERAAAAGNLAAEAALLGMGRPVHEGEAYARDLVARIRAARDPEAYAALSVAAASGRDAFALSAAPVPSQFNRFAWLVGACRLGLDCGPDSTLVTSYCVHGGICSRNPEQGFEEFVLDAGIPEQSEDVLRDMVQTLIGSDGETL